MLKPYVLKTNFGILGSFLFLGAGYSIGDMNNAAGVALVLTGVVLWFYGLAAYARGKGHSAWHAIAGIFYLLGLIHLFRLKDRHPSGSPPESSPEETALAENALNPVEIPVQEARRTFAIVLNVILNFFLFIYFAALAGFLAGPVMQAVLLRGLPQTPAGLQKLVEALTHAWPFLLVSMIIYSVMKRLWRLQVSGAVLQAFICVVVMAAGFPWGALAAAPALLLLAADSVKRRGFSAKGVTLKTLGFGGAAGALAAIALHIFQWAWMFDFKAGFEIGAKYWQGISITAQREPQKSVRPAAPVQLPVPSAIKKEVPSTHVLTLQSGKRIEGSGFREESGYYLTLPGMGEVYFGKNEVLSVETL